MKERQEERLSPLTKIGEGFGEWFEILLKIRRTKEVGTSAGFTLHWGTGVSPGWGTQQK